MRKSLPSWAFIGLLIGTFVVACHLGTEPPSDEFELDADISWTECDTLEVVLLDGDGRIVDTLFRDSLASLDQLKRLPAGKYRSGKAQVRIKGYYPDGGICLDQRRTFEDDGARMTVDTLVDPGAMPRSVSPDRTELILVAGGGALEVKGTVEPSYTDQELFWTLDDAGVASLDIEIGEAARRVKVKPEKVGEAILTLRSRKDSAKASQVRIRVDNQPPRILARRSDTVISIRDSISMGARVHDADNALAWIGWDYQGDGRYDDSLAVSDTLVQADFGYRYADSGSYLAVLKVVDRFGGMRLDTARIKVETDAPVIEPGLDLTVLVGAPIRLVVRATDRHGPILKRELKVDAGAFASYSGEDTTFAAPSEPATLTCILRVTDTDGLTDEDTVLVTVLLSSNAELDGLEISSGTLDPAFKPSTQLYSVRVDFSDSLFRVVPRAKSPTATLTVNGSSTASGSESAPIRPPVGSNLNLIQVVVTAPDGTQRVYSLSVVRGASLAASLSGLDVLGASLRPAFASNRMEYTDTVPHAADHIAFKPTLAAAASTLSLNGNPVASGVETGSLALKAGENRFTFVAASGDGALSTTYRINIVRLAQLVVTRKSGEQAPVLIDSSDLLPGGAKAVQVPIPEGYRFVRWTLLEGEAGLSDSGSAATSISMRSGKVRAQAEFVLKTYTLTATATPGGTLSPDGETLVAHGQGQAYVIKPDEGYRILSVKVAGTEVPSAHDGSLEIGNVTSSQSIQAAFGRTFIIMAITGPGGTVSPLGSTTVDEGGKVDYTITPFSGFRMKSLLIDGVDSSVGHDGSFTFAAVSGPHTLEAGFIRTFPMAGSVAAGMGTMALPSAGADSLGSFTWKFKPDAGYRFSALYLDDQPVTPTGGDSLYTLSGIADKHVLKVHFLRQYRITILPSPGGVSTVEKALVDSGQGTRITLNHAPGYRFDSLWINGAHVPVPVGRFGPYGQHDLELVGVTADQAVQAAFRRYYKVQAAVLGGNGSLTPLSAFVDSGAADTLTFNPADGFALSSVLDNDVQSVDKAGINRYILPGVTEDHVIWVRYIAVTTFQVGLGTNIGPPQDRANYLRPKVCVEYKAVLTCDTVLAVELPEGAEVSFIADPSFESCSMGGCYLIPFQRWEEGTTVIETRSTPMRKLGANTALKAIYGF